MSDIAKEFFDINIVEELKKSYMDYAMSVIISRALPDVRDGLKPVQRRILVAMNDLNLMPSASHRKSAKIAGDTSGNYHPHGEAVIYPTMVRMAQDFNARYPLIDGQGNMGSIDGDPPAAMRYTEMRMSKYAVEMLQDLDKDTVNWQPNYDQSREEPLVLPAKLPYLLTNGSSGIAVGMATNIPPHNLSELCDGFTYLIDNPECQIEDLMEHVKGPDFPTRGLILGTSGIKKAYETGRGSVVMQAQTNIEPLEGGKSAIIITELPYQVNKTALIEKIAMLAKEKKVDGITEIPDYSDRNGMRIQIELKKDAQPKRILNYLYKHTELRKTFGVIMLALVDGAPHVLNLKQIMSYYLKHRYEIIVRRTKYDLRIALRRAHIVEGLLIAIDNIDEVVTIIRGASSANSARDELMERFALTWQQATAILDMQLRQLSGLERGKLEDEYMKLLKNIASMEDLLSEDWKIFNVIKEELAYIKSKHGDERKTRIIPMEASEIGEEDMIPIEQTIITITRDGYIKRVPIDTYRTQTRGGKGKIGASTKELDKLSHLFTATTHHIILFFTDRGRVYKLKAYEIPQTSRTAMGTAIINLINIEPGDKIVSTMALRDIQTEGFLILATEQGEVKRTDLSNFQNIRSNGLLVFDVEEGDSMKWVGVSDGTDDVILATRHGISIRFSENDLRVSGRTSGGVRGIRLSEGDKVVGMTLSQVGGNLLCVTENGFGKQTNLSEYRSQTRGGKGIKTMKCTEKTGFIVETSVVNDSDRMVIITENGITLKMKISDIRETGRSTQGVKVINLALGDTVASIARVPKAEEPDEEEALEIMKKNAQLLDLDKEEIKSSKNKETEAEQINDENNEEPELISEN